MPVIQIIEDRPQNTGWFGASMDIFGSDTSPHNCYGLANDACRKVGYRPEEDDVMRPRQDIDQLAPTKWWNLIYWQNHFLPPVYQPPQNNHGEKK